MKAKAGKVPIEQAWETWKECLEGKDPNSIFNQIGIMLWDTLIFRVIVEGRRIRVEDFQPDPEINSAVHSFIDRIFFQTQASSARRLIDKSSGITGAKGVFSLSALINDIFEHRSELTREMFFALHDLPHDLENVRQKELEYIQSHKRKGFVQVPHSRDALFISEFHANFDMLCNVDRNNRNLNDTIPEMVFSRLLGRLEHCDGILNHVDKFIAHSATPESREIQGVTSPDVTFVELWEAHKTIYEVAEFLSVSLFSVSHMPVPIENPTFFDYLEIPLYAKDNLSRAERALSEYRHETNLWREHAMENISQWLTS
jgi:hypothetical protein